jgi:diguanylate cyclase (GGDEF)-like protein
VSTEEAAAAKPIVLIVDDSRVIRIAARKILKDEFEPLEAGDGEEAWEMLNKHEDIALVLSDLSMPYLDGMGLLNRLRNAEPERLRSMPMVIVTGAEDDDEAKTRAFAAGASDFISKPFDSVQLLAHTRSHIRLQKTTQELKETTAVLNDNPATDPFTGLGNQRAFLERAQQSLAQAIRHRAEMALILFQVDNFDKLFVQHGKPVGGAILKAVTAAIQTEVRREDAPSRISMARFGLVTCCADADGARGLAARICARLAQSVVSGKEGAPLKITLSASIVAPDLDREPRFEQMLGLLVKRLEQALAQGNCVLSDESATPTPTTTPAAPVSIPAPAPQPQTSNVPAPSIEAALAQLASGDSASLRPYLRKLVSSVLPLLNHWNQVEQRGLESSLERIRSQVSDN